MVYTIENDIERSYIVNKKSTDKHYSIDEFSKRIGVASSTLRNWDKSGTLVPHHRTPGGHRVYTEEQAITYLSPTITDTGIKHLGVEFADGTIVKIHCREFSDYDLKLLYYSLQQIINNH